MEDSIIVLDNDSTIVLDSSDSDISSEYETTLPNNAMNIVPMTSTPTHTLLESVHARFEQNRQESARRVAALKSRRLFEKAHRNHLLKNVISPSRNTDNSITDNESLNILTSDYHKTKRKFIDTTQRNTKRLCASTTLNHNTDAGPIYISDSPLRFSNSNPNTGFTFSEERCCPIIDCGLKMSTEEDFEFHMMSPIHTPCNPFQNILDSSLPDNVIFYLCPKCGQQFKDIKICSEHQEKELHNEFIQPIAVSGFLCPLCLHVFPTESSCIEHMQAFQHLVYHYGFSNDKNGINCKPIPLPKHLALDFKSKCDKVNSWVTCVDCNLKLDEVETILDHLRQNHLLSCVADKKPADVFSEYLGEVTCSRCQQIFRSISHRMFGRLHCCTIMLSGIFQANDCRTFEEFVRRSSIAIQVENMPPPSPSIIVNSERNQKRTLKSTLLFQSSQPKKICLSSETNRDVHSIGTKVTKLNSINHKKSSSERKNGHHTKNQNGNSDNIFSIENPFKNLRIQNNGFQKSQVPQAKVFKAPIIWDVKDLDGRDEELTKKMLTMNQIIFLDLDNWPCFFKKLPFNLPDLTFVWAFYGGAMFWKEPHKCHTFDELKLKGYFHLNKKCGRTKDAADFALVLHVGKMDERLPKHISFTILSGDKGFVEVENQLKHSRRQTKVIDPHTAQKESYDFLYALLKSLGEK